MATFNIDEMKSGFQPADVHFRGEDYKLGKLALGILQACNIHGEIEDLDGVAYMEAFLERLPRMLTTLCEEFPTEDLDAGESMALLKVCVEVLGQIGQLTFPSDEQQTGTA